jgi:tetratricopeptide (TPR) repeat protein
VTPDPEVAVERAFALLELQRPQEALEHLAIAIASDPEIPQLHCLVALAKLQLLDAKGALQAAETAVAGDPEEEWAHRLRAIALIQLGRKQDARDAALEAARLEPELATTHLVLASALQATGDEAGALAAARHAVELDPDDGDTHSTLGEVLFEQERLPEAIAAYETALRINPEDGDTLNNLAVARLRSHDREGVDEQFETVAMLDPRHAVARHNILHTGIAGRTYVMRRWAIFFALLAIPVSFDGISGGIFVLLFAIGFEAMRIGFMQQLGGATRQLVIDDRRARRLKPHRWDWTWPGRLRPWWWIALTKLPAPLLLAANLLLFAGALAGVLVVWAFVLGIALPFSLMRTWRWFRRRHPGADSWRPPA